MFWKTKFKFIFKIKLFMKLIWNCKNHLILAYSFFVFWITAHSYVWKIQNCFFSTPRNSEYFQEVVISSESRIPVSFSAMIARKRNNWSILIFQIKYLYLVGRISQLNIQKVQYFINGETHRIRLYLSARKNNKLLPDLGGNKKKIRKN